MVKSILSVLLLSVVYIRAEIRNCDDKGVLFYEQFTGCQPIVQEGDECPIEFYCPEQKVVPGKCVFQGKEYTHREGFEKRGGCTMGCSCNAVKEHNSSSIMCPAYDCPFRRVSKGCYQQRTLGDCCGGYEICPTKKALICNYKGNVYGKGQAFYPENTCYKCVCQEGFNGELVEPFCKKVTCGLSNFKFNNLENKCAPFYIKTNKSSGSNLCCPYRYICGKDSRILNVTRSGVKSGQKCDFKNGYDMFAGDVFEVDYESNIVTCTCHLPPYASCTGKYF